jgi:tetratricopeptide (TPR) repeat protein
MKPTLFRTRAFLGLIAAVVSVSSLLPISGECQSVSGQASVTVLDSLATAAMAARDWGAAARSYQQIVSQDPKNADAWFNLGVAQASVGQLAAAKSAFEKSIAAGAAGIAPQIRLARVLARQNDASAALRVLERIAASPAAPQFSPLYLTNQPDFDSIRANTEFAGLVRRLEDVRFPCRNLPESHLLDFWLGRWDVTVVGKGSGAHSEVSAIDAHCWIAEHWTDQYGGTGSSMNFYDPQLKTWRQIWVADGGGVSEYSGSYHDNAMWFDSVRPSAPGVLLRLVLHRVAADTVRQVFENSSDGGKTWIALFDGLYVRSAKP